MLGNKMKSRLEQSLDPAFVKGWNEKLLHVWDVAASMAQVAGAEYQLGCALTDCIVW